MMQETAAHRCLTRKTLLHDRKSGRLACTIPFAHSTPIGKKVPGRKYVQQEREIHALKIMQTWRAMNKILFVSQSTAVDSNSRRKDKK